VKDSSELLERRGAKGAQERWERSGSGSEASERPLRESLAAVGRCLRVDVQGQGGPSSSASRNSAAGVEKNGGLAGECWSGSCKRQR
jgi:hypothetical protein